jgi:hypothetical protein
MGTEVPLARASSHHNLCVGCNGGVRDGGPGDPMNIVLRGNNLAGQIPEEIGMLNNSLVIL